MPVLTGSSADSTDPWPWPGSGASLGPAPAAPYDLSVLMETEIRLSACAGTSELFATASVAAQSWFGCARALIVTVEGQMLTAGGLGALQHAETDLMRRRLLAEPVALTAGSVEASFIRAAQTGRGFRPDAPSVLAEHLALENYLFGAIRPEEQVLALLVLDGLPRPIGPQDRQMTQMFARMVAVRVENLCLRQRMREFALELRYLTTSARALVKEGLESPVTLPSDENGSPVFPLSAAPLTSSTDELRDLFTPRELTVIREVAAGRSNREIAEHLHISHETVKKYVSRVMEKVGAANRADAAVRYLRMAASR